MAAATRQMNAKPKLGNPFRRNQKMGSYPSGYVFEFKVDGHFTGQRQRRLDFKRFERFICQASSFAGAHDKS